jgi:hypothetical protein
MPDFVEKFAGIRMGTLPASAVFRREPSHILSPVRVPTTIQNVQPRNVENRWPAPTMDECSTQRQVPKKFQCTQLILFGRQPNTRISLLCSHGASTGARAISYRAIQIALLKIRAKQVTLHAMQDASLHPMFVGQFGANRVLPHQCDAYGTKSALWPSRNASRLIRSKRMLQPHSLRFTTCVPAYGGIE